MDCGGGAGSCRACGECRVAARVTRVPLGKHSNPLRAPEGPLRSSVHWSFTLRRCSELSVNVRNASRGAGVEFTGGAGGVFARVT